jgi:hypothetical protein
MAATRWCDDQVLDGCERDRRTAGKGDERKADDRAIFFGHQDRAAGRCGNPAARIM